MPIQKYKDAAVMALCVGLGAAIVYNSLVSVVGILLIFVWIAYGEDTKKKIALKKGEEK